MRAREEAKAAEAAKVAAQKAAKEADAKMSPVSVFISRQTQRLYVRQAFQPIFDTPITVTDADKPIGTHIYTALDYVKDGADVRWSAVSMTSSQGRATQRPGAPGPMARTMATRAGAKGSIATPSPPRRTRRLPRRRSTASPFPRKPSTASPRWCRRAPRSSSRMSL